MEYEQLLSRCNNANTHKCSNRVDSQTVPLFDNIHDNARLQHNAIYGTDMIEHVIQCGVINSRKNMSRHNTKRQCYMKLRVSFRSSPNNRFEKRKVEQNAETLSHKYTWTK